MRAQRLLPAVVTALSVLSSAPASAGEETQTFALSWVRLAGAEACIGPVELARAIDERLGRRVIVPPASADVSVEGRVEPSEGGGFRALIALTQADGIVIGSREVVTTSANCRELDPKLVLVIALTVDPDATERPPEHDPSPPPEDDPAPSEPRTVVRREVVYVREPGPKPTSDRWTAELRVAGAALAGVLPGITPGAVAAVSLEPPKLWPIELWGSAWLERDAGGDEGARLSLFMLGLRTCPSVPLGARWHALACAGAAAGALRARGFGFDRTSDESKLLILATAGIGVRFELTANTFAQLGVSLDAALLRPRFFYEESTGEEREVHRVPAVGGHAELGLGLRF